MDLAVGEFGLEESAMCVQIPVFFQFEYVVAFWIVVSDLRFDIANFEALPLPKQTSVVWFIIWWM